LEEFWVEVGDDGDGSDAEDELGIGLPMEDCWASGIAPEDGGLPT